MTIEDREIYIKIEVNIKKEVITGMTRRNKRER